MPLRFFRRLPDINLSLHSKLVIVTWLMVSYLIILLGAVVLFISVTLIKSGLEVESRSAINRSLSILAVSGRVRDIQGVTSAGSIKGPPNIQGSMEMASNEMDTFFSDVYSLRNTKEESVMLDSANAEWQQLRSEYTSFVLSSKERTNTAVEQAVGQGVSFDEHVVRLTGWLDRLAEIALRRSADVRGQIKSIDETTMPALLLLYIVSLAINTISIILIIRSVVSPTHVLAKAAHSYAQGSLSYRIPMDSANEIGELAKTFNYMAEKLESRYISLEKMATQDGLTGIINHSEFRKRLHWEIKRAHRYRRTISLVMMDIDRFKVFNDTYGHQAGDNVLGAVGQFLRSAIRSSDEAARYGGEEFALIMPETPAETAYITAQRIGKEIAWMQVDIGEGKRVSITMSIGVATFPQDAANTEELISAADRALYLAKQSGRNCVCKCSA